MKFLDKLRISHYHHKREKQFDGEHSQILGWQDLDSQISRFEALCGDFCFDNHSVLDVGCGYGDLLAYLESTERFPSFYTGVDLKRSFVSAARKREFLTNCTFLKGDFSKMILKKSDFVFASGSLNYQTSNANHTVEMIRKMYDLANVACVFNLLDQDKLPAMKLLESHNKEGVLRYCRLLCPESYLIEGYSAHDFTVVMLKKAESVS
ncbi:class I SAM-dependent methyltransferase [Vibrio rotiferianus]|uniref:class I SAM-dependent methyltransferase n=1 Tax=Vibrio rotiferianus TaxID=190895 RepID=UPI00406A47D5